MYLLDYHVHTKRCGHAAGEDRQYIETAIQKGLSEMGFSDHVPRFYQADGDKKVSERGMSYQDLEEYVGKVLEYKREYHEIRIKLGLEVDFVPGWEREIEKITAAYPWDYILGSVHFISEWNYGYIGYEKEHPPAEIYPAYFRKVAEAAESGLFDILAHIDLPKRFFEPLAPNEMSGLQQNLAERIGRAGTAVELNTYGIRSSKRGDVGIFPDPYLLQACRQQGVPVTLGSDAHTPKEVGEGFDRATELLKEVGYDQLVSFQRRKRSLVPWQISL